MDSSMLGLVRFVVGVLPSMAGVVPSMVGVVPSMVRVAFRVLSWQRCPRQPHAPFLFCVGGCSRVDGRRVPVRPGHVP